MARVTQNLFNLVSLEAALAGVYFVMIKMIVRGKASHPCEGEGISNDAFFHLNFHLFGKQVKGKDKFIYVIFFF